MAKVSIITATRNRPDLLRRCIRAIQHQDWDDYEHIIVGDHCPYAERVWEDFKDDKHLIYTTTPSPHVENHGATGKNKGIEIATGKYIAYCDDDNILLPNHSRLVWETLEEGYDLVFSKFYSLDIEEGNNRTKTILNYDLKKLLTDVDYVYAYSKENRYEEDSKKLFDIDMLVCGHRTDLYPNKLKWPTVEQVGPNEDGSLMWYLDHRLKQGVFPPFGGESLGLDPDYKHKTKYIDTPTAIYSSGGGHHDNDEEYNKKRNNLGKELYVYE